MKKFLLRSLVTVGVVGCAGPVIGETSWDWYGEFRIGAALLDSGDDSSVNVFDRGSFIGIRGARSLGAGPEVYGRLESLVQPDQGSGLWASRETYLGIRDHWGSLQVGHFSTPVRDIGRKADLIWSRTGDSRTLTRTDNVDGFWRGRQPGWDDRWGNSVAYYSPSMAGLKLALVYSTDPGGNQSGDPPNAYNAAVSFDQGPLWVAVGYEMFDEGSTPGDEGPTLLRIGASYRIGGVTLSGLYNSARDQQGDSDNNRDIWGIGAGYKLSDKWSGAIQYYKADDNDALIDSGAQMIAGELVRRISRETSIYFAIAHTDNDDNARFDSSRGVVAQEPIGKTSTSGGVTVRHRF